MAVIGSGAQPGLVTPLVINRSQEKDRPANLTVPAHILLLCSSPPSVLLLLGALGPMMRTTNGEELCASLAFSKLTTSESQLGLLAH